MLDYYGTVSDETALREAIRARGLSTRVEVHSPYHGEAEMGAIMEGADLLVLLSDEEGFPMTLLESLAISALENLYRAFSRTYDFPQCELVRHRKQNLLSWGKHCLALAYKQNWERGLGCRAALVASGTALLSKGALQIIS